MTKTLNMTLTVLASLAVLISPLQAAERFEAQAILGETPSKSHDATLLQESNDPNLSVAGDTYSLAPMVQDASSAYYVSDIGGPTNHTFECLAPTEVLCCNFHDLEEIMRSNTRIKKVKDAIIMDGLLLAIQRNERFVRESPEKRYLSFMETRGELLQRVSQKHIASYLGITAVSFSRLKKRIYMQQDA